MPVVFDAAHGFGATRDGRPLGTFGAAEVFSLSPTKPMTSGEGGLVAIRDDELAERVRLGRRLRQPGRLRHAVRRAQRPHVRAARGRRPRVARRSRRPPGDAAIAGRPLPQGPGRSGRRHAPEVDPGDQSTYKDFTVIVDESVYGADRDAVAVALKAEGVDTRPYFYPPVHRQQAYADLPARRAAEDRLGHQPRHQPAAVARHAPRGRRNHRGGARPCRRPRRRGRRADGGHRRRGAA